MTWARLRTSSFCSALKLMISGTAADLRPCTASGSTAAVCVRARGNAVRARLLRARIGHVAQRGFDRGPHLLLIRRQMQPLLDARDLRVVEHVARPVLMRRMRRRRQRPFARDAAPAVAAAIARGAGAAAARLTPGAGEMRLFRRRGLDRRLRRCVLIGLQRRCEPAAMRIAAPSARDRAARAAHRCRDCRGACDIGGLRRAQFHRRRANGRRRRQ